MIDHIGQRIKEIADNKGVSVKELSAKTQKTNSAIYDIFKKKDVSSELLREFSRILEVPVTAFLENDPVSVEATPSVTQYGTANAQATGSGNKQKVEVGKRLSGRQEVYGMGIDELYVRLMKCESERDKDREVFTTKISGLENLLAAKDEMISVLRGR